MRSDSDRTSKLCCERSCCAFAVSCCQCVPLTNLRLTGSFPGSGCNRTLQFGMWPGRGFDSDAFIIGVDNHVLCCMDAKVNHVTNLRRPKQKVVTKGIIDGLTIKTFGTVHWNITDNQGRLHHMAIDNSALVPDLPHALLSPQHWSQKANDHFPIPHGTIMEQCKLYWGQKNSLTQFRWILSTTLHVFIWHLVLQNFVFSTNASRDKISESSNW